MKEVEKREMRITKKKIALIALILTLAATNATLAVMYLQKDVSITGGVATQGAIEIYQADGTTPLTTLDFPLFTADPSTHTVTFYVENTGNVATVVYWDISNTNPADWAKDLSEESYIFTETGNPKYRFSINKQVVPDASTGLWKPSVTPGNGITLDVGQNAELTIDLMHFTDVNTPGTFSFTLSFFANDA